MQVTYDGVHSLLIGDFIDGKYDDKGFLNTWTDLHLVPSSMPVIQPPPLKSNFLDIPGANGAVDMTEILTGRPLYENRTGSIEFYIDATADEYCGKIKPNDIPGNYRWDYAYDKILNSIHGFRKKVILTDARSYYYEGRVSINDYKSDKLTGIITLDYELDPFKMSVNSTTEEWLWNPFDFINGIIPTDIRHMFVYQSYGGESSGCSMDNNIAGVVPQIPVITAFPFNEVDWSNTRPENPPEDHEYPGLEITPYGASSPMYIEFNESDRVILPGATNPAYRLTNPTTSDGYLLTIGDPRTDYKFEWKYRNYFRDSDNEIIPTMFYFDFRPRRL